MAINLGSVVSNLASGITVQSIAEQVATGAIATAALGMLQGHGLSLDPLHLMTPATPAPAPAAVQPTITASAFASLPPVSQSAFLSAGGHIIAG